MNPISYARHLSSYSSTALARNLEVSRQYLSRLEQGLYDSPNNELLKWTVETINKHFDSDHQVNEKDVKGLYNKWQWQKRGDIKINKALRPLIVTEHDRIIQETQNGATIIYYYKIFAQWRQGYWDTTHGFCVDMCLHPSPITSYEEGNTQAMPKTLKEVLKNLGLLGEGFKTSER